MHVEPDLYGKVEASTVDTREPISRKSQSTTYNSNCQFHSPPNVGELAFCDLDKHNALVYKHLTCNLPKSN